MVRGRLKSRLCPDDAAAREKMEATAIFQTGVLMFTALSIGVVVWLLLHYGYPIHRALPSTFLALMLTVFFVGLLTAFPDRLGRQWANVNKAKYKPSRPMKAWGRWRPGVQRAVVFALSFCLLLAFVMLVWETGLGIESPFIPLVTAPAVFGPFVALYKRSVMALVIVVSVSLGGIALWAPTTPCPHAKCMPVSRPQHPSKGYRDAQSFRPRGGVYIGIAVTLVFLASLIAANRLERETQLEAENERLDAEVARLRSDADARSGDPRKGPAPIDGEPEPDLFDPV
jgi:hypothetical protein